MIQELQLRILPEEAVSEQSLKQVVARETGTSVPYIHTVRVLKRSIDARQRTIYYNPQNQKSRFQKRKIKKNGKRFVDSLYSLIDLKTI